MSESIEKIVQNLQKTAAVYQQIKEEGKLEDMVALKEWQCNRLLASHIELWKIKRFQPAIQFFISELYGPKDFSQRDADIAKVIPKMEKWLPEKALNSLGVAIHLNCLSQDIDYLMLEKFAELNVDLQNFTAADYAQAYKNCGNTEQRAQQINSIEKLGTDLGKVVKIPGISMILRMARTPAKTMGVDALQQFLEDGLNAFKKLGTVSDFIYPVVTEERRIMHELFAGENILPDV